MHSRWLTILGALLLLSWCSAHSCSVSFCHEDCDPCVQSCQCSKHCHGLMAAPWEEAHRLVAFELASVPGEAGAQREVFSWIAGLSLPRALARTSFDAHDLRAFSEGVIGVNRELLDLDPARARWAFASVELGDEQHLVVFRAEGELVGELVFLYDAAGRLLEIERELRPRGV